MENTLVKKSFRADYESVKLTIGKIEQFIAANEYQFKDRKGLDEITETNFNEALQKMSLRKRKKIASYMWSIDKNPKLGLINKFFHFIMKNVLKSESRVRVIQSAKEIAIQEKRKAYKEALAKMQAAYADYKFEKGDFYKSKLGKNKSGI